MKMYTRRALSWVLAIALLITCGISGLVLPGSAEQPAGATELFPNGDFEDGAVAPWTNFAADSTHWAIGDGYGIGGSWGMKWIWKGTSVDSTVYAKFDEAITITEPGTYRFSFSSTMTGTTGIKVGLDSLKNAAFINNTWQLGGGKLGDKWQIASKSTVDHKGEWTTYHADFVVTEETVALAAEEGLSIWVKTGDVNTYIGDDLAFDNFSLKKWDENQGLIMDGDFDNAVDATFFGTHASTSYRLSWLTNATKATIVAHPNGEAGNRVLKLISGPRYMGDASYFVKNQSYLVKFDYSGAAFQLYEGTGGEFVSLTESGLTMNLPETAENEWKTYAVIYTPAGTNAMRQPLAFTGVSGESYIDNFSIYNYYGPDTLEFAQSAVEIEEGVADKELKLTAKAYGFEVPLPDEITWETSNAAVATVADGVVTAVAAGEATITAKAGELTATCKVTVNEEGSAPVLSGIALNKTTASVKKGATVTLTVTGTPAGAALPTIEWTTSDAAIATVENGVVTGVKAGNATITAKAGDFTATCEVTVTEDSPAVPADGNYIVNGDLEQGADVAWGGSSRVQQGVGKDGGWGIKIETTVDENTTAHLTPGITYAGLLKKLEPNTKYILTFDYKHEGKGFGQFWFNGNFGKLESGTAINAKSFNLTSGEVAWKTVTYEFTTPSEILNDGSLLFRQVQYKQAGNEGTGVAYYDNIKLIKKPDVPALSGITIKETLSIREGDKVTLTVAPVPEQAVVPAVEWTTSDANVVTVENGAVTGVKAGTATITAKVGDFTATCAVTIKENDGNLLINGDFEEGADISWAGNAAVKDGVGKDGSIGLEVSTVVDENTTSHQAKGVYYKDAVVGLLQPDTVYEISFDVKHAGKGFAELYLNKSFGTVEGSTKAFSGSFNLGSGDYDWKRVTYVFVTPSAALSTGKGSELLFRQNQYNQAGNEGTGTTWFDNIKLVKVRDVVHADELVLAPSTLELLPKGSGTIKTMTLPEGSSTGILTYTSSNPEIATVTNTGAVTALVDSGEVTITVTNDKGKTATAKVVITEYADLIQNGGFEQGGINWNDTPRAVSGVGKDGTWGLQMLNPTPGSQSTVYYKGSLSAMKPGTTYILTYDYFTTKGSKWRIWSGNLGFSGATHTAESTEWKTYSYIFKTPNDLALNKGWDFAFVSEEQGSDAPSIIDNVTLRKYTTGVDAESIRLSPETLTLIPGRTGKLALYAEPDNGDLNDTKYTSSNHNVAIVEDGVVTAVGNGTATITAITKNGKTATCVVTVSGDPALIKNGTFDIEGDNSWNLEGGAQIVAGEGSLETAAGSVSKDTTLSQKITGLKPSTPYTLSMKFRTKSGKVGVKIVSGETVLFEGETGTGTSWKKTTFEFTTPENIGSEATVIFTPAGSGPAYFDNVSLTVKASLVDFVVTDMYWIGGNQQVKPGTELKFGVTVVNQGQDAVKKGETIVVELRKNGKAFMTLEHKLDEDMTTGGNALVTSTEAWKAEKGNWTLSVRVNPALSILEVNSSNNTTQKDLRVADEILVAPDQALEYGMTDLTFSDEFDSLDTIDQYATGNDGYKWYVTRQWSASTIKPDDYSSKDGVISLISKQPGYHVTLATMDVNTGVGYTWNKGYLEVRMRIPIADPGKSNVDYDGSPAIWSFPDTKWLETSGQNRAWVEMDWLEYWGVTEARPGGYYTVTFHDQRTASSEDGYRWFSNKNAYKEGLGDEQWHTMGWLWTHNMVIAYIDGVQVFKMTYSENDFPSCGVDTHDSVNHDTTGAFSLMNEMFNVLFISGSEKFPLELDYVRIWQSSTGDVILPDSGNDDGNEGDGEEDSTPIDVNAEDFWWYYGADDYGDLITEITEENYEIILSGGELWDRLSEARQKEIDALFVANGQPSFTELLAEAQKFAENLGDGSEGEGESDGESESEGEGEGDAPEAEKPAGTGATTALPAALATVMLVSSAALWVSRKRKREQA